MKVLLTSGFPNNNANDKLGFTALHIIVIAQRELVVEYLLFNRADLDSRDIGGATALCWSAQIGFVSMTRFWCEKGANIGPNFLGT